jgi:hypothetical protein
VASKQFIHGLLDIWVQVNRIDKNDLRETSCKLGYGLADILEAVPEVLSAVAGNQDQWLL